MLGIIGYNFDFSRFGFLNRLTNENQRYIEGYLESSQTDIDQAIITLTRIGLTKTTNGEIKPALATSWQISQDGKNYDFTLVDKVKPEEIKNILMDSGEDWSNIQINAVGEHGLQFVLKKPFAPLLATLANPIFEYGPYILYLQTDSDTMLKTNPNALIQPKIDEVIFRKYSDVKSLSLSLKDRRIDGTSEAVDDIRGFTRYELELNKLPALICNIRVAPCNDLAWRTKFFSDKNNDSSQNVEIIALDNSENRKILSKETLELKVRNFNVNIKWVNSGELMENILPERKYQLLFTGIDYGIDNDPYPFWHSSQIEYPGLNLSGINDYVLDQILEHYRVAVGKDVRSNYWQEFEKKRQELYLAKLYSPIQDYYIISSNIKIQNTVTKGFKSSDRFDNVEQWTRK